MKWIPRTCCCTACSTIDAANQEAAAKKRAAEARKQVGAGGTAVAGYAPLTVFRDAFKDGSEGPEMIVIPAGSFQMGSELGHSDDRPVRTVRIAKPFALGKTEVTQAQWRQVMGSDPPTLGFKDCDDCPVEGVSWNDVQDFIRRLNTLTGKTYRLPSEAEWESAAKAGSNFTYSGGDNDSVAWHPENNGGKTHPVGRKSPNAWGLYDMSGNVWEWVEDVWHEDYTGAPRDGSAWVAASDTGRRVQRGGSWGNLAVGGRVVNRNKVGPSYRGDGDGFRLARMLP